MKIERCDRCGNENEHDRVYYCRDCHTYFCDDCIGQDVGEWKRTASVFAYHDFCPECDDGGYIGRVGVIKPVISDELSAPHHANDSEQPTDGSTLSDDDDDSPSHDSYSYTPSDTSDDDDLTGGDDEDQEDEEDEEDEDDEEDEEEDEDPEDVLRELDGLSESELEDLCTDPEWRDYVIPRLILNRESNICKLAIHRQTDGVWAIESRRRLQELAQTSCDHARAVQRALKMEIWELDYLSSRDPNLQQKLATEDEAARRQEAMLTERRKLEQDARRERWERLPGWLRFLIRLVGGSEI